MVRAVFADIIIITHKYFKRPQYMHFLGFFYVSIVKKKSKVTYVKRILTAFVHAFDGPELKNSEYLEMR